MDERQSAIKEGEGLAESRLNQDFVDFIKKWGMHALLAVALLALAYRGYQFLETRQTARIDDAFRQLEAAGPASTANPRALLDLAADFEGVRAVATLARLRAADAYMVAVRRGVHPGAVLDANGNLESENDLIDEADRALFLDNAEREYRTVRTQAAGKPKMAIHELNGLYGLAAVAESRGDLDVARGFYEEVISLANAHDLQPHEQIAQHRIDTLPELEQIPHLYAMSELPDLPWEVQDINLDDLFQNDPVDPDAIDPDTVDPGAIGPEIPGLPEQDPSGDDGEAGDPEDDAPGGGGGG